MNREILKNLVASAQGQTHKSQAHFTRMTLFDFFLDPKSGFLRFASRSTGPDALYAK